MDEKQREKEEILKAHAASKAREAAQAAPAAGAAAAEGSAPGARTELGSAPAANATATAAGPSALPGQTIRLTERAAEEVLRIIQEEGLPEDTCLRVGAKGGGCSGFSYVLDFDKQGRTEFDEAFEFFGVTVLIDKKSEFVMAGTIVDFQGGLLNRGFVFENPSANGTCGCGTSFSV